MLSDVICGWGATDSDLLLETFPRSDLISDLADRRRDCRGRSDRFHTLCKLEFSDRIRFGFRKLGNGLWNHNFRGDEKRCFYQSESNLVSLANSHRLSIGDTLTVDKCSICRARVRYMQDTLRRRASAMRDIWRCSGRRSKDRFPSFGRR